MIIVVTGADGFIGENLLVHLAGRPESRLSDRTVDRRTQRTWRPHPGQITYFIWRG